CFLCHSALTSTLFPYTTLFRSSVQAWTGIIGTIGLTGGMWLQFVQPFGEMKALSLPFYIGVGTVLLLSFVLFAIITFKVIPEDKDRKSTRLNSSHVSISYAVFC